MSKKERFIEWLEKVNSRVENDSIQDYEYNILYDRCVR